MARNKRKKDKKKQVAYNGPVRELSYREIQVRAWKTKNPTAKELYHAEAKFMRNCIFAWYDDGTVLETYSKVDDNGNRTIVYQEIQSSKIVWHRDDFDEKVMPHEQL